MKFFSVLIFTLFVNIFSEAYAGTKDEAEFLNKMIKHHQSGVHMSEVALQKSKNQEILKLAKNKFTGNFNTYFVGQTCIPRITFRILFVSISC